MKLANPSYPDLTTLVTYLRSVDKKYILLYASNGTGKTRLSMEFKEAGKKNVDINIVTEDDVFLTTENGDFLVSSESISDTLYFNAFTEDLFYWDNDLENDVERILLINKYSRFVNALRELEMENKIRPLLQQYSDFNFLFDYEYKDKYGNEHWAVNFIREIVVDGSPQNVENIKVSRSEENLFIWCFFLAVAQLAIDKQVGYTWVKNIYIDDPVSSLDENNVIALAHHLAKMLKADKNELKTVISTHHSLFFNVLCNEFGNAPRFVLKKTNSGYALRDTSDSPFQYHLALVQRIQAAVDTDNLFTYHFNDLRTLLEKAANFHGFTKFSDCLIVDKDDEEHTLHTRMVNIMNHGGYSLFEPVEMLDENKIYFKQIFANYKTNYKFNPQLLQAANEI